MAWSLLALTPHDLMWEMVLMAEGGEAGGRDGDDDGGAGARCGFELWMRPGASALCGIEPLAAIWFPLRAQQSISQCYYTLETNKNCCLS